MADPTVPAAIAALVSAFQTAVTMPVYDGQPPVDMPAEFVAVEFADTNFGTSGRQEPAGLGGGRRGEQYDIRCLISAYDGSADMAAVRGRAFDAFTDLSDAIRSDATLSGTVMYAEVTDFNTVAAQIGAGANYTIQFSVSVRFTRI